MSQQYICIHNHFYQPPRENPWLEEIELQESAYPFHDWNERIAAECYATNAAARILNGDGRIADIVNNFAKISFNFGATLLSWMEKSEPAIYQAILDADKQSQEQFSGHGSAIAQAYNHMILPLSNREDKYTQILWGIRDFEHRFGRSPEGMWLPETAVDLESLDILAELGIKFTILAPHQAHRVRRISAKNWRDVTGQKIDPKLPYIQKLPSGRQIVIFFYDGPISRGVAFERLLVRGEDFANRLLGVFDDRRGPQIVHIATDGETYGHHHRHGDMALAYALKYIEEETPVQLTVYGEYMEKFPPRMEVEIYENTAWSCVHGVERWRSDCGCNSGGHGDWTQAWREPLRNALDWLRDELTRHYVELGKDLFKDPMVARNEYVSVILDRSSESIDSFFGSHAACDLNHEEKIRAMKLLEMQRHAMLMYTSCGWFFDELSGIETVQVIQYAGRAVQLGEELFGDTFEEEFLNRLEAAKSNIPDHRDGRQIYEKFVRPAYVDLTRVAAHFAVNSTFETPEKEGRIHSYKVELKAFDSEFAGRNKIVAGQGRFTSETTLESRDLTFATLFFGEHNLQAGVRDFTNDETYRRFIDEMKGKLGKAEIPELIRIIDRNFGPATYSLSSLFQDQKRKILDGILGNVLDEATDAYARIYEQQSGLLRFLVSQNLPVPHRLRMAAEFVLNINLQNELSRKDPDHARVKGLLEQSGASGVNLDAAGLSHTFTKTLNSLAEPVGEKPENIEALHAWRHAAELVPILPFEVDLWKSQNIYFDLLRSVYNSWRERGSSGDEGARVWMDSFEQLGRLLNIRVE